MSIEGRPSSSRMGWLRRSSRATAAAKGFAPLYTPDGHASKSPELALEPPPMSFCIEAQDLTSSDPGSLSSS